jgi:hypothetical protein
MTFFLRKKRKKNPINGVKIFERVKKVQKKSGSIVLFRSNFNL